MSKLKLTLSFLGPKTPTLPDRFRDRQNKEVLDAMSDIVDDLKKVSDAIPESITRDSSRMTCKVQPYHISSYDRCRDIEEDTDNFIKDANVNISW